MQNHYKTHFSLQEKTLQAPGGALHDCGIWYLLVPRPSEDGDKSGDESGIQILCPNPSTCGQDHSFHQSSVPVPEKTRD